MSLLAAYDAYIPVIPSPLNPYAPSQRRRSFNGRGRIPMSPSEKLLRRKAAEAWRSETIHRQVERYEYRAAQAVSMDKTTEPQILHSPETQDPRTGHRRPGVECPRGTVEPDTKLTVPEDRHTRRQYLFRFPDLSFLTPKRLLSSVGFWHVFSPWRMRDLLRGSRTSLG